MSMTGLSAFDTTIQKANVWLKAIMESLEWHDKRKAYLALSAVLQTLRDRLTFEEVVKFGAQLPMILRGLYYEGWDPSGKPVKYRHIDDFLMPIKEHFRDDPFLDVELVVRVVFDVISKNVSSGEVALIKNMLPKELSGLWPKAA